MAHESCNISGEMLSAMAGRLSRAYVVESPGVSRPDWTIEGVAEQMERIRATDTPVIMPFLPSGFQAHMRYSFEMVGHDKDGSPS
jgi:hypothetical protein